VTEAARQGGTPVTSVVVADIGGTHARFAIAEVAAGRVISLGEACTLRTADHASLRTAWEAFSQRIGGPPPPAAAIALAGPVSGEVLKFANIPWVIRPALIPEQLGVDRFILVNDFGAVGHGVGALAPEHFRHLTGPEQPLPTEGVITVLGPGTGLGVAQVVRRGGRHQIVETEGGHMDFAPLDSLEDSILAFLRARYRRVSVERVLSGPGLANLFEALGAIEGRAVRTGDDAALWGAALDGADSLAAAALDRFCLTLGAVAGDLALAHGAGAVVIVGGLATRLADHLPGSGFRQRFIAKGRFEHRMAKMPVSLITHPQPGLYGAAAAFAARLEDETSPADR
jgi:glucokinase